MCFSSCKSVASGEVIDLGGRSLKSFSIKSGTGSVNETYAITKDENNKTFLTASYFSSEDSASPDSIEIADEILDSIMKLVQQYDINESIQYTMENRFPPDSSTISYSLIFDDDESIIIYIEVDNSVIVPKNVSDFGKSVSEIISGLDEEYLDVGWRKIFVD